MALTAGTGARWDGSVAGVRDLLDRFRPAGAPGPAGAAGVPADRRESAAAELAPVFTALDEVEQECDRLRRAAAQAAAERRAAAAEQARAIVARARNEAGAERAAAAARVREDTAAELAQVAASAAAEADEVRRRGAQRLPQLLSQVVERVHADLAALNGAAGTKPPGPAEPT
jgi:flagellar biosynthesis/type III secretory pathway protein FliH